MPKTKKVPISLVLYCGYIVTVFLFIYLIKARFGDDGVLFDVYAGKNIITEVIDRYNSWSSRVFIDAVMIFLATRRFLYWKVATFILMSTLPYFLMQTVCKSESAKQLTILLVASYPMLDMASCGWVSCSINYIWPLWCLVFIAYILKKSKDEQKIYWFEWVVAIGSVIFGASHELVAVYMLVIIGIFVFSVLSKKKHVPAMIWVLLALSVLELILILASPANGSRSAKEADIYIAGYNDFSLFTKLGLGISNVIRVFVADFNVLFIAFFVILCASVFIKTSSWIKTLLPLAPIGISFGYILSPMLIDKNYIGYTGNALSFLWAPIEEIKITPMPIIYFIIIVISVVLSFYWITENIWSCLFLTLIAGIGMATAVIMGFSPTIYASENRPFIFLQFTLIYLGVYVFNHIGEKALEEKVLSGIVQLGMTVLFTVALSNCFTTVMLGFLA